jgi:hypothetical protein
MKNKIKNIGYSAVTVGLTLPMIAAAQFKKPANTGLTGENSTLYGIIENVMKWLLAIVGIVGVIGFAIAGLLYLTSAGDEGRIEKAKNAMLYAIVGVVVALAGLVALNFATKFWGGDAQF